MSPSARSALPYALALLATLAACAFALTVSAADASAATREHCKPMGRAVTLRDATAPADFSARLSRGDSVTLTEHDSFALTEVHAYPAGGGASRQYRCTARRGVDVFDEWRTDSGRIVARFDGVTFRASARAIVKGWEA